METVADAQPTTTTDLEDLQAQLDATEDELQRVKDIAAAQADQLRRFYVPPAGVRFRRPWTTARLRAGGALRVTIKRRCDTCNESIGDVKQVEIHAALSGRPLPDVTAECPYCTPLDPEPGK